MGARFTRGCLPCGHMHVFMMWIIKGMERPRPEKVKERTATSKFTEHFWCLSAEACEAARAPGGTKPSQTPSVSAIKVLGIQLKDKKILPRTGGFGCKNQGGRMFCRYPSPHAPHSG